MTLPRFVRLLSGILVLVAMGCGRMELPPSLERMIPRRVLGVEIPRRPRRLLLEGDDSLTLLPNAVTAVEMRVDRAGAEGPIVLDVAGVPEGLTVTVDPSAADQSQVRLTVAASPSLGDQDFESAFSVGATIGEDTVRKSIAVRVPKVERPEVPRLEEIILQPGTPHSVSVPVRRNGFVGPLQIGVLHLPTGVSGTVADVSERAESAVLRLAADPAAEQGRAEIKLATRAYGRDIVQTAFLNVTRRPLQLEAPRVATLAAGGSACVPLRCSRQICREAVAVEALGLPAGVSMRHVTLPGDAEEVSLEVRANESARACVASAIVRGEVGHLREESPLVIRVVDGQPQTLLPRSIIDSEKARRLLRKGSIAGRVATECKRALCDLHGSSVESDACVRRGLAWLAGCQQPDGSWTLRGVPAGQIGSSGVADDEPEDNLTVGTAFGLLPFLAEGVSHLPTSYAGEDLERYQDVVKKGLGFLARRQVASGDASNGYLGDGTFAHAIGTVAVCEGAGLSSNKRLRLHGQDALEYLRSQQLPEGGWRSGRELGGDLLTTAWAMLAIRGGQVLQVSGKGVSLKSAQRFLDDCAAGPATAKRSVYALTPAGEPRRDATAAALLVRQYFGWERDEPELLAGRDYLMSELPPADGRELGPIEFYFFATQVLRNMEGEEFDRWNHRMREHLVRTQEKSGPMSGSWDPRGTDVGPQAGRVRATALSLLTLQVYYRQLPLYREIGTDDGNAAEDSEFGSGEKAGPSGD